MSEPNSLFDGAAVSPPPIPPPLANSDLDAFRRKLVGLAEPDDAPEGMAVDATVRNEAIAFVGTLADLHQRADPSNAVKVWEHVVKSLNVAAIACDGRDFAEFACACLPPLGVPPELGACDEGFTRWLTAFPPGDVRGVRIVKYLSGPTQVAAVAFARAARKEGQLARENAKRGGEPHA